MAETAGFQYKTIRRLNKNYLVRCNESLSHIIPGNGVRPASKIHRLEREIKALQQEHGKLLQSDIMTKPTQGGHASKLAAANKNDQQQALLEMADQIKRKQKLVDSLYLH